MSNSNKIIRIGGFSAFWGDTSSGAEQLVLSGGKIDYIIGDYLAEVTMGILGRGKQRSPRGGMGEGGYVAEFVSDVWIPLMKEIMNKGIKIVTNAGGMNPVACKNAIEKAAKDAGIQIPLVAAVTGDDLTSEFPDLVEKGALKPFSVEGEEEDFGIVKRAPVLSCNAYLGAFPIAEALNRGAQIVVTGRCVDSALVLGPLIHEFGWKPQQLDLLAAGSVAGHLIECATQSTGGNFTDWQLSLANGWDNVGFPIAECKSDGSVVITKPANTGGLVSKGTVCEQMIYEILDPANYTLPDVNVDFTQVTLDELQPENNSGRVLVRGARGKAAPPMYKASIVIVEGWRIDGMMMIGGREAAAKAEATAKAIFSKVNIILKKKGMKPIEKYNYEILGAEHSYGPHSTKKDAREVIMRLCARHISKDALNIFAKEVAPAATAMAPAITGGGSGRPQPLPALGFRSCLVPRDLIKIQIHVGSSAAFDFIDPVVASHASVPFDDTVCVRPAAAPAAGALSANRIKVPLIALCHGRSGDKGDVCNIGIICRRKEHYELVKSQLTAEKVKEYMAHLVKGQVVRYELPGTSSLNFVCTKALNGGGLNSMNMDRQGKCYAQMLLDFLIELPQSNAKL